MDLSPVAATSAVDACARQLEHQILAGRVRPGDRLPPERDLARDLGVNRTTLRSALGRLASLGLVRARQGSGYAVLDYRASGGTDLLAPVARLAHGPALVDVARDLLAVRRALGGVLLERLSAIPARSLSLGAVEAAVTRLAETVALGKVSGIAEADVAVIGALAALTGSAVLQLCTNPIAGVLAELPALREAIYADASDSVLAYRLLLGWLRAPRRPAYAPVLEALIARDERTLARLRRTQGGRR